MIQSYEEELKDFLDKFCDLFFVTKEELSRRKINSTLVQYRALFFYCCRERFPIISSTNIGKVLNKSANTVNSDIYQISFLVEKKNKQMLKKLRAVKKNII